MAIEIEHKFLLSSDDWRQTVDHSQRMGQAYLASDSSVTVRTRIAGEHAWLTLKGRPSGRTEKGLAQLEFEYEIPVSDAVEIISELADSGVIDKTRHTLQHAGHEWVIDEFHGDNEGLIVAEIELESETEEFKVPDWAGPNVTADYRYRNKFLAHTPYKDW